MNYINKNVFITGISGFDDPYIAKELVDRGANIYGLFLRRNNRTIPKNIVDRVINVNLTLLRAN
jgi:GDP-D-mannose dehydratase